MRRLALAVGPRCAARNKVADTPALRDEVLALFATGATPKQIEVALRPRHGLDLTRRVSHETIYDFIYVHSKGSVKKELIAYLRRKKPRRSPAPRAKGKLSGQLPGAINIGARPAEVERREVPGHWEADLVMGAGNRTAILVITELVSRYVMIVPLGGAKDAISVARALIRAFKRLRPPTCARPSPTTTAAKWPNMPPSPLPQKWRSTSAIHTALGSAVRSRISTV
ncbi:MAG: IS30 family transposase [Candidatus Synoicihabitans palmerolidicus]|nr:IS30 family transposase [Candidatus Synoicihabitans palmerolidicus]